MRQKLELTERQARVGIIANPAPVALPVNIPRDLMTRWPDLRSPRRLKRQGHEKPSLSDPVLAGQALAQLAQDMRRARARRGSIGDLLARLRSLVGA